MPREIGEFKAMIQMFSGQIWSDYLNWKKWFYIFFVKCVIIKHYISWYPFFSSSCSLKWKLIANI